MTDTYGSGPAVTVIRVMTAILPCTCRYGCTRETDALQALQITGTQLTGCAS